MNHARVSSLTGVLLNCCRWAESQNAIPDDVFIRFIGVLFSWSTRRHILAHLSMNIAAFRIMVFDSAHEVSVYYQSILYGLLFFGGVVLMWPKVLKKDGIIL